MSLAVIYENQPYCYYVATDILGLMYDTILVPTDGSDGATAAVEHAIDLAATHDATVHALYAADMQYSYDFDVGRLLEIIEKEGESVVEEVAERCQDANVDSVTAVRRGDPSRVILEYADDHDADIIVMGTHGRRGLVRFLLGSVAERVLRLSETPVLAIRQQTDSNGGSEPDDEMPEPS